MQRTGKRSWAMATALTAAIALFALGFLEAKASHVFRHGLELQHAFVSICLDPVTQMHVVVFGWLRNFELCRAAWPRDPDDRDEQNACLEEGPHVEARSHGRNIVPP